MERIKEKLIDLRANKGISQTELARQAGFSTSTVSAWENGERKPSVQACLTLARFYGINLENLVDDNLDLPY